MKMERTFAFYKILTCSLLALISLSVRVAESCSCMPAHPQTQFCESDFVAVARVWKPIFVNEYEIAYRVKINRIFKNGQESRIALGHAKLYTASEGSLCGATLNAGETYVVSGRIISGKPRISLCSIAMHWPKVTSRQRKGFRQLYHSNCQCKIRYTSWISKGTLWNRTGNNTCLWESTPGPQDCQERYGICLQGSAGCSWHPSGSYKNCIKEYRDLQRRRGHQKPFRDPLSF